MKKILIIDSHPRDTSLVSSLADSYQAGAEAGGAVVTRLNLRDLEIDWTRYPWGRRNQEEDLIRSQEMIKEADHLVFAFPVFWGLYPALLKGFIDRVFLPGFAFESKGSGLPIKLLTGRTARLLYTMDAPSFFHRFWYGMCVERALEKATFWYVGIKAKGRTSFHGTKNLTPAQVETWLKKAETTGRLDASF